MFKLKAGWTKQKMLDVLLSRNHGTKSMQTISSLIMANSQDDGGLSICVYRNPVDNRCAVGCFLPDGHPAEKMRGGYTRLIFAYPELENEMPLDASGMQALQNAHDQAGLSTHEAFKKFVEEQVCSN